MCHGLDSLCLHLENITLSPMTMRSALDQCIRLIYHFYVQHDGLFFYFFSKKFECYSTSPWFLELQARQEKRDQLLAQILAKGIDAGEIMAADACELARALLNMVKGCAFDQRRKLRLEIDQEHDIELIRSILSDGIIVGDGGEKR
jgi:hypothetical protein